MKKKIKNFFSDFRKFVSKGNVMDLAVAVVIGGAFGKIVTSLVNDIIMPLVTAAIGANTISELSWVIRKAVEENGEVVSPALTVNWGSFLQNIIDFLIIAFFVFLTLRALTAAKNVAGKIAEEAKEAAERVVAEARELLDRRQEDGVTDKLESAVTEAEDALAKQDAQGAMEISSETAEVIPAPLTGSENIEVLLTEIRDLLKINKE